jgi:hypothetical protein
VNVLRFILLVVWRLLQNIAYQWVRDLVAIVKRFCDRIRYLGRLQKLPHPKLEEIGQECLVISHPSMHRPDPCIYSQPYLLQLGLPVTWDNPDIVLMRGGAPAVETALLPNTDYEIQATIWNNSYEAPVVGLRVDFAFLSFGVGVEKHPIGTTHVDLGVKGGAGHPALAKMAWRTPAAGGHFCIQAEMHWIDDANPANNLGQNNVDVATPQSPAQFAFRLRNDGDRGRRYAFEVDTYSLPALDPCKKKVPSEGRETRTARLKQIRQKHDRAKFPVPAGWTVEITPANPSLTANEEIDVAVRITPPTGFAGAVPFNVNAVHDGGYAGGVSLIVATA